MPNILDSWKEFARRDEMTAVMIVNKWCEHKRIPLKYQFPPASFGPRSAHRGLPTA